MLTFGRLCLELFQLDLVGQLLSSLVVLSVSCLSSQHLPWGLQLDPGLPQLELHTPLSLGVDTSSSRSPYSQPASSLCSGTLSLRQTATYKVRPEASLLMSDCTPG